MDPNLALELRISRFLRWGVVVTGILLAVGTSMQFQWSTDNPFAPFHDYVTESLLQRLENLWATRQWGPLLSYTGLFILISLPLIRVFLTAFLFWKQRERVLAALATAVLILLILSFSLGIEV